MLGLLVGLLRRAVAAFMVLFIFSLAALPSTK